MAPVRGETTVPRHHNEPLVTSHKNRDSENHRSEFLAKVRKMAKNEIIFSQSEIVSFKMIGGYEGGYEGGWNPADYLQGADADFPIQHYKTKANHDYMDFRAWAEQKYTDKTQRDNVLTNIYKSAKMMKFHPRSQRT